MALAKTYRNKITNLIPKLYEECGITEQVFDIMLIAETIGTLAKNPKTDAVFLERFAYTKIFTFMLENYVATKQQTAAAPHNRVSDNLLSIFNGNSSEVASSTLLSTGPLYRRDSDDSDDDRLAFQTA